MSEDYVVTIEDDDASLKRNKYMIVIRRTNGSPPDWRQDELVCTPIRDLSKKEAERLVDSLRYTFSQGLREAQRVIRNTNFQVNIPWAAASKS